MSNCTSQALRQALYTSPDSAKLHLGAVYTKPAAKSKIVFITGPTAVGKTETAAILAKKINAEIVSFDSMQIYRGMDIITSKASKSLRKKIIHHLIDIIPPNREYNVSKYRQQALKKIKEILKKKRVPLFVGGTGLYMTILIDGIFKQKSTSKAIRKRLYKEAKDKGSKYLHKRLQEVDSLAASRIHFNDTRRIIRALEVFESTGKPITLLQQQRKGLTQDYDVNIFCLNMERAELKKIIERRIERMFAKGLVMEVKRLLASGLSKTAYSSIGIKELEDFFNGEYDLTEAKRRIKRNTLQFAKRQLTWFRKDKRIHWVNIDNKKPRKVAEEIYQMVR